MRDCADRQRKLPLQFRRRPDKGGFRDGAGPALRRAANGYIERNPSTCYKYPMDKTIRKYSSFEAAMKADEYRYWQSRSVQERMDAVSELTLAIYAMKGAAPDLPILSVTSVRFQHPRG